MLFFGQSLKLSALKHDCMAQTNLQGGRTQLQPLAIIVDGNSILFLNHSFAVSLANHVPVELGGFHHIWLVDTEGGKCRSLFAIPMANGAAYPKLTTQSGSMFVFESVHVE